MKTLMKYKSVIWVVIGLIPVALLIAFRLSNVKKTPPTASPPQVEVAQVEQKNVPIYGEWIGTLDGMVNADIKAQVTGYLLKQYYTDGSLVKEGQLLFEIDPRSFQAALEQARGDLAKAQGQLAQAEGQRSQAKAQLAQAEANQGNTQNDLNRLTPLVKKNAISTQDFDHAVQANLAAKAQVEAAQAGIETATAAIAAAKAAVEAARAAVSTAETNLSFTRITSPINGIAGIAQAQIGNLVGPNSSPLTTVSTLDPIKVYFTGSEQEYLNFTRLNPTQSERDVASKGLELELILADGTTYGQKGRIFAIDRQVGGQTGTIRVAAVFPNPGNTLRPGQYARVRAATITKKGALLVPQRAVTELQGSYRVAVVGDGNKVSIRSVKVGERAGSLWVIEEGLRPGESVVAEGTQKVKPDMVVNPKPFAMRSEGASDGKEFPPSSRGR